MKHMAKTMKNTMKIDEKHCKNNEHQPKLMKNIAKTMKNNEI